MIKTTKNALSQVSKFKVLAEGVLLCAHCSNFFHLFGREWYPLGTADCGCSFCCSYGVVADISPDNLRFLKILAIIIV